MTKHEALLMRLAPKSLRLGLIDNKYPHVSHCAGTAKLLGDGLGAAICETLDIKNQQIKDDVTSISCLIRAFIVLDDFAKDKAIDSMVHIDFFKWIEAIREETLNRLSSLTSNADALWSRYEQSYHDAYYNFFTTDVFRGVISKCFPIFLPLHIDIFKEDTRIHSFQKALEEYLFCLQTMDDFKDMEEDIVAPKNHNVFLVEVSPRFYKSVIVRRTPLARTLLPHVCRCVSEAKALLCSRLAIRHFEYSINWLKIQQKIIGYSKTALHLERNVRNFHFRDDPEVRCLLIELPENLPTGVELRAETMHTVVSTE